MISFLFFLCSMNNTFFQFAATQNTSCYWSSFFWKTFNSTLYNSSSPAEMEVRYLSLFPYGENMKLFSNCCFKQYAFSTADLSLCRQGCLMDKVSCSDLTHILLWNNQVVGKFVSPLSLALCSLRPSPCRSVIHFTTMKMFCKIFSFP